MKRFIALILFSVNTLCGCAYLGYVKDPFQDIPSFDTVDKGFYRGGCPNEKGYASLHALGIKTIIDLTEPSKRSITQDRSAQRYGMRVVHIPLSIYTRPEDEKVLLFLQTVIGTENRPVFLHCDMGHDRTGAMVAVYRVFIDDIPVKTAYQEAVDHGFWPYRGEVELKKYMHQLKDRKPFYAFVTQWRNEHGETK
jgi:protein tyrosine phosphatase (PTP) superfamily phosphohydrolase (DUF442 family)